MDVRKKGTKKELKFSIFKIAVISTLGALLFGLFVLLMVNIIKYRIPIEKDNKELPFEVGSKIEKNASLSSFELNVESNKIKINPKTTNVTITKNGNDFETLPYQYFDEIENGIVENERQYNLNDFTDKLSPKSSSANQRYRSPLNCTYIYRGSEIPVSLNGFELSVKGSHFNIFKLKDGFRVEYEIAERTPHISWLPPIVLKEEFEKMLKENPGSKMALRRVYEMKENENTVRIRTGASQKDLEEVYLIWKDKYNLTDEDLIKRINQWNPVGGLIRKAKFVIPVEYRILKSGDLSVVVLTDKIQELTPNMGSRTLKLVDIELLPYLVKVNSKAANDNTFLFIPDGSGAIIKPSKMDFQVDYKTNLYNNDVFKNSNINEKSFMQKNIIPFLGAGEKNSGILADVCSGFSMLNTATTNDKQIYTHKFNFRLKEFGKYEFIKGTEITSYEEVNKSTRINIKYYFFQKAEPITYFDFVKRLQEEYFQNKPKINDKLKVELEVLGAFKLKEHILGMPYTSLKKLTTYDEFYKIKDMFQAEDILYKYSGFSKGGINGSTHEKIKRERKLGSKADYKKLLEDDIYLDSYILTHYNSKEGSYKNSKHGLRVLGGTVKQFSFFNKMELKREEQTDNKFYLAAPNYFNGYSKKYLKNNNHIKNIAFRDLGSQYLRNYTFRPYSGDKALLDQEKFVVDNNLNVMLSNSFFHVARHAKCLEDMPLYSNSLIQAYSDIPFIQLLYRPYIKVFSTTLNLDETKNYKEMQALALLSGTSVKYSISYRDTDVTKESDYFNKIYSTSILNQDLKNKVDYSINEINNFNQEVKDLEMTDHKLLDKNVYSVTYETKQFIFNLSDEAYNYLGNEVLPKSYRKVV